MNIKSTERKYRMQKKKYSIRGDKYILYMYICIYLCLYMYNVY